MHIPAQKEAARQQLMAQLTPQQRSFFAKRRQASSKPSATRSLPHQQPTARKAGAQPSGPSAARSITAAEAGSEGADRLPPQPTCPVPAKSSKAPSSSASSSKERQQSDAPLDSALTAGLPLPTEQPGSIAHRVRFSLAGEPCSLQQEQPQPAEAAVLRDPLRSAPVNVNDLLGRACKLPLILIQNFEVLELCTALPGAVL